MSTLYRIIALTLAGLMFFTSVGFSVDTHYCQGQLKSFSFFGNATPCHDMVDETPMKECPRHEKMMAENEERSVDKKNCCSNKTLYFHFDEDQQSQNVNLVVSQQLQQFVIAYVAVFLYNDFIIESYAASYAHYKPPLVSRDIPVLFESFLL
jgi:hypothetical protein